MEIKDLERMRGNLNVMGLLTDPAEKTPEYLILSDNSKDRSLAKEQL